METASSSHGRGKAAIGIKSQFPGKPAANLTVERPSSDYTHFVSLPLAIHHRELIDKLLSFQSTILGYTLSYAEREGVEKKNKELGIERSIFVNPTTFHLTLLMLKLGNNDRVAQATQVLQNSSIKVMEALKNRPIFIRLKGLDLMRGSPAQARVLYAPVEEIGGEGRLLHACKVIIDAYMKAGLVLEKDAKQTLKLHATIMNAKFRKSKEGDQKRESFDARGIFKQYGSEEWGDYIIRNAHLSQRFAFDENGYYHCCASIAFPETRGGHQIQRVEEHEKAVTSRVGNMNDLRGLARGRGIGHDQVVNMNGFQGMGRGCNLTGNINDFQGRGQGRGRGSVSGRAGNTSDFQGWVQVQGGWGRGRAENMNEFQDRDRGRGPGRGQTGNNNDFQGRSRGRSYGHK